MSLTLKELDTLAGYHRKGHSTSDGDMEELFELAREALQAKQREPDCWAYRKYDLARDEVTYHVLWPGEEQNHDNDPLALYAAPQPQGKDSNER